MQYGWEGNHRSNDALTTVTDLCGLSQGLKINLGKMSTTPVLLMGLGTIYFTTDVSQQYYMKHGINHHSTEICIDDQY